MAALWWTHGPHKSRLVLDELPARGFWTALLSYPRNAGRLSFADIQTSRRVIWWFGPQIAEADYASCLGSHIARFSFDINQPNGLDRDLASSCLCASISLWMQPIPERHCMTVLLSPLCSTIEQGPKNYSMITRSMHFFKKHGNGARKAKVNASLEQDIIKAFLMACQKWILSKSSTFLFEGKKIHQKQSPSASNRTWVITPLPIHSYA